MTDAASAGNKVGLARTLGPGSIILMGIGSLLGGGIFTLLGPAAGLVGPGLFLSMILGAGIAFLNLQMYLALGTTFPEAGGGYLWVRKGLGNFQGFQAGWMSWFAHAAACGVYAISFGFYAVKLLEYAGLEFGAHAHSLEKGLGVLVVLLFGWINWRGAHATGRIGNYITIGLVGILATFIVAGIARMAGDGVAAVSDRFVPLLPHGLFGVIASASFFYIAFEGSEIQVQAGEEAKNPARDLKIGLLASWAVVSIMYVLISLVVAGAGDWQQFAGHGEGAIIEAARGFLPWGAFLMTLGGLLANLAALNTTIFSSSHVSFALARDKNIWAHLARIHLKNLTPHVAVIVSTALIAAMVAILPLFDVAAVASLLFVLLFLQLNAAGISIHFKLPDTKWKYRIPGFPATPIAAIILFAALALSMLRININAWMIAIVWMLIGLVNYFSYALVKGREEFENEIVFEEAVRVGAKSGKRVLLPVPPELTNGELKALADMAVLFASRYGGELVVVKIHEAASPDMVPSSVITHDKGVLDEIKERAEDFNRRTPELERDVNFHNLVLVGRDVTDVILDVVKNEQCDLLILNWDGYVRTKGAVFGRRIDRILREAQCDLLVVKDPKPPKSVLVATNPKAKNPYLPLIGELYAGVREAWKPKAELLCIVGRELPAYLKPDPTPVLAALHLPAEAFDAVRFQDGTSVAKGIIDRAREVKADLVIVGAAKQKFLKDIRFGSIPESLAKHLDQGVSLFIAKGHAGIGKAFWERLNDFMKKTPR